jgi:thioredoxin reductase
VLDNNITQLCRLVLEQLLWRTSKSATTKGYVKTDKRQQTNINGLFAAGDVQNPYSGALEAAYTGGKGAFSMRREWYD